jgi:NAD(P)-dependent dehydrogenase (short-subunit alcohol dehydrogenase family)
MDIRGRVTLITGGAGGIGEALGRALALVGAKHVVLADRDQARTDRAAAKMPHGVGVALAVDVTDEAAICDLVERVETELGPIDICCSNAGLSGAGGLDATNECWQRLWDVHVMAQVFMARAVLPRMVSRGRGHLVQTASAAGVLTNIGNAPYSVTKHATVALAEWIAINYGDLGIGVSCLCPQAVRTEMLLANLDDTAGAAVLDAGGVLEPDAVAVEVVDAVVEQRFFVLPHPEVADYVVRKATDPERWLAGMRRARTRLLTSRPSRTAHIAEHDLGLER